MIFNLISPQKEQMWTPPLDATVDMYRRRQDLQQQKKRSIPIGRKRQH